MNRIYSSQDVVCETEEVNDTSTFSNLVYRDDDNSQDRKYKQRTNNEMEEVIHF